MNPLPKGLGDIQPGLSTKDTLNEVTLRMLIRDMPPEKQQEMVNLTPDQCLEFAIIAEEHARMVGPADLTFQHFTTQQSQYMKLALLLEKRNGYMKQLLS